MNILDLIQSSGAISGQTPGFGDAFKPDQGPDIQVMAEPKRQIEEDDRVEPNVRKTDELIPRKGMFGVKGTLRDVLGLIGDSLLVGGGKQAIYRPVREQEKLGSAIYGYNANPQAAIDRAAIVNPEAAMDLQKQYGQDKRTDQLIAQQVLGAQQKARTTLGSMAQGLMKNPQLYAQYRPQLQALSDKYELGHTFGDTLNPEDLDMLARSGLTPDQGFDNDRQDMTAADMQEYRNGQLGVSRQRAAEQRRHNTKMENRPQASRVDHGPGASNIDAQVLQSIQNGSATPAQQRYYDQRLKRAGPKPSLLDSLRGGSGGKGPPPPPNGGSFRKVK